MRPTIKIDASEVTAMLQNMIDALDIEGELGRRIANQMRRDVQLQFSIGGDPAWPALSERTIRQKRRMGYPRLTRAGTIPASMIQRGEFGPQNILMRTGALLSSWTRADDPDHYERIEDFSVEIGSTIPYADAHQKGVPARRLPRRPIRLTQAGLDMISRTITDHISEEL